ncbi:MAG: ABC transporter permease [Thermoleophilia bacterium]|jgi:ABC-2 type transport system permease protein
MRALSIAWKDLRHTYRDLAALAMMILAPLALALALGAAFGGGSDYSLPTIRVMVVDADEEGRGGESAGRIIVNLLNSPELTDLLAVRTASDADAARKAVDEGDAEAAVLIPAGLTERLYAATPTASSPSPPVQITIYRDPAKSLGTNVVGAVLGSVTQSLDGSRAAAITTAQLALAAGIHDPELLARSTEQAATAYALQARSAAPISLATRSPITGGDEERTQPNVTSQVLIGMMVFFMLFGAATPARSIIDEHRAGTLFRLFTTPTPRWVILGGKYIGVFLVVLLQSVILLAIGQLFLGAHWGPVGPVAVVTICGALMAASLGLLTVSFAKTPGQAGAISSAIFVFLGLIGGNFIGGASSIGGAYAIVRRLTPNGWLLEAWNSLLFGGSWAGIATPILASLGFTLLFFLISSWFFSRRYA